MSNLKNYADELIATIKQFIGGELVRQSDRLVADFDKMLAALPVPVNGKDGAPGKDGVNGKDGEPGKDIHPDTVAMMVAEQVAKAIASLPVPKDGAPGRDAAELIVLPGIDITRSYPAGTCALHDGGEVRADRATDPLDGKTLSAAGWRVMRDGVKDTAVKQGESDPREFTVSTTLTSGRVETKTMRLPAMIYKEVWREGEFVCGDVVTWSGSAWHCQADKTNHKPGTSADWKLMVKSGAPGKDGGALLSKTGPVRMS
jgi:hypothetical protein